MIEELDLYRKWLSEQTTLAEKHTDCKRKGVAAILVDPIASKRGGITKTVAFNGPSDGMECSNEVGNCGCVHAETRVLIGALKQYLSKKVHYLLIHYSPCTRCAQEIVLSGIVSKVFYKVITEHDKRGLEILNNAGIETRVL